jgi:hypothetical protein
LSLLIVLLGAAVVHAQSRGGTLRGVVQDAKGFRLVSAQIAIRMEGPDSERAVTTDERGEFRMDDVAPGDYRVIVTARNFADASERVAVSVSAIREIVVTMNPSTVSTSVQAQATSSSIVTQPVDFASQVHQAVITQSDLKTFPLAQRSFANIAYLAPGTEPVEPSDPTKARITAVSTGGSSGLNNELSVDGMDNTDDYIGGFLQNISTDAIQEFSMRTAQEDADTGGTTAGSVVIVTRRGTDAWHGGLGVFERAAAMNARYPIENPAPDPKQPYSRQDYLGTFGGPLLQRKLFVFGSFEDVRENAAIAYSPTSTSEFNALAWLASAGLIPGVGSIAVPASVPVPFRDAAESLRLDWTQSAQSSWFLRGSGDVYSTRNNLVEQATLPSTGLMTHNRYWNVVAGNQFLFGPRTIANFTLGGSGLRLTQTRNSNLGFALAFPFSSTALTVSGFETYGDNQFATPITSFPSLREQEKYQARYDLSTEIGPHSIKVGVNFIHEPVLSGSFPDNTETLYQFPQNPSYYVANPDQLAADMSAGESTSNLGGGFAQNVQRLSLYAQDSWRAGRNLTLNYGLRYSTTLGLLDGAGRSQSSNPAFITLNALAIPLAGRAPGDDHKQFGPRAGLVYSLGKKRNSLIRAGLGIYLNDLAQTGWATAFQAVHAAPGPCVNPVQDPEAAENAGCLSGHDLGGAGNMIAPNYRTPYALHITAGFQHAFSATGSLSADYTHEQGNHGYRAYSYQGGADLLTPLLSASDPNQSAVVPDINAFHSDNRSGYDALMIHVQDTVGRRLNLAANYTFSKAQTWGCVLGELFDYVNGVCDPLNPFGAGDYGPSGEDVRHRFVLAGVWHVQGGLDVSTLTQAESARPFTITTADGGKRIAINGNPTALDQFRGTPYIQADIRIARPFKVREWLSMAPFIELFNVFNRNNPGANFVTNVASLPVPAAEAQAGNVTDVCTNEDCTASKPLASPDQLRVPAGGLGDFFGPGTTVGAPFAAQIGLRIEF